MRFKKFIGICLALSAFIGTLPTVCAAKPAIDENDYFDIIEAAELINFDENSVIGRDEAVTREKMAAVAANIYTPGNKISGGGAVISDVPSDSPSLEYIRLSCECGAVTAADGVFRPDDPVTEEQALKAVFCAMGYEKTAMALGAYPGGYIKLASQLDIDFTVRTGVNITGDRLGRLLYEFLDVPYVRALQSENALKYEAEGKTLAQTFDIFTVSGLVSANDKTSIFADTPLSDGEVMIDKSVYYDLCGAGEYIGGDVFAWCKGEEADAAVFYVSRSDRRFKEITLSADEIDGAEYLSDYIRVSYTRGARSHTLKLSLTAREFYNLGYSGASDIAEHINSVAKNKNGTVRLADNFGSGIYDAAYIEEYETYVVKSAAPSENRINLKDSGRDFIELDENKTDYIELKRNGAECEISKLAENDIITYYVSENGKIIRIYAIAAVPGSKDYNNKIEGRLISIKTEDGYATIELDGLVYDTTVDFWQRNKDKLSIGLNYTVYLNSENQIAWMSGTDSGEAYGFLLGINSNDDTDSVLRIRLLGADNSIVIYECADRLTVYDGDEKITAKEPSDIRKISSLYDRALGNTKRQVVKYFVDDWGKISRLYAAKANFAFECVKATEYKDDGELKSGTRTADYSEADFLFDSVDVINPSETPVYVKLSADQGGRVPINVRPIKENTLSQALRLDWANYEVGQYIADDKTFDFIKYYDGYGLGRNSRDDKSDELKNTPGKIHSLSSSAYASIDTRYIADAKTVIFRISARVDENGNITNDNDADLSGYQVISTSELPYGSDGRKTSLLKLYDMSNANEIGAMTVVDNSSLPNGEGHFSENAVVSGKPYWALDGDGQVRLAIPVYYRGGYKSYMCVSDTLSDDGSMLKYFDENGNMISPTGLSYYGDGNSRAGKYYGDLKGIYSGRKITDLKEGDFVKLQLDRDGFINAFVTLFDGDTSRTFYEDMPSISGNYFGSRTILLDKEDESFPYGKYTNHTVAYNESLAMSPRTFIYGEAQSAAVKVNTVYWYAVVKTCLPFFAYRDRLGTNNGSHEMLYRDSEGNTFFPVERSREIHNLTDVALYDSKENTVTKSSISAICEGDKLVMLQPQYNSVGQIVIYR